MKTPAKTDATYLQIFEFQIQSILQDFASALGL